MVVSPCFLPVSAPSAIVHPSVEQVDQSPQINTNLLHSGHCVKFAPRYEAAAKTLQDMDLDVRLAKVDCTRQAKLCQEYNIRAYPTMKVFKAGQELYHDYTGPRRSQA